MPLFARYVDTFVYIQNAKDSTLKTLCSMQVYKIVPNYFFWLTLAYTNSVRLLLVINIYQIYIKCISKFTLKQLPLYTFQPMSTFVQMSTFQPLSTFVPTSTLPMYLYIIVACPGAGNGLEFIDILFLILLVLINYKHMLT